MLVNKEYNTKDIKYVNVRTAEGGVDIISRGLGIVLFVLLFMNLFYGALGHTEPLTFTGFFEYMSNFNFDVSSFTNIDMTIYSDWGLFNFLRDFINQFTGILSLSLTIMGLLGFVVVFLFRIVAFFF